MADEGSSVKCETRYGQRTRAEMGMILQKIDEAEMILIGIGEEFDDVRILKKESAYEGKKEGLLNSELSWLFPLYQRLGRERGGSRVYEALCGLAQLMEHKNYFVVATTTNDALRQVPWREGRLVMPCGGGVYKQCVNCCEEGLMPMGQEEIEALEHALDRELAAVLEKQEQEGDGLSLGRCPRCGAPLILNNIYAEHYDEKGYLKQWELYTKWLQGTLNKKLLILELGVGLQFPSVIRWPFEKIAFFNQKAEFYRVNEKLYHLSEELKEKGLSISENAIDWLQFLC